MGGGRGRVLWEHGEIGGVADGGMGHAAWRSREGRVGREERVFESGCAWMEMETEMEMVVVVVCIDR